MDGLDKKTLDVSRGFTYTYYTSPAKDGKHTLLLLHGFPDAADSFEDVIRDYLQPQGYGAIAVDCLGYNGSSKPTDTASYDWELIAKDLKEIVEREGLAKVIPIGHDWGSGLAQRFYNFNPSNTAGLALMSVAYIIPDPTQTFDLDAVLQQTQDIFGYGIYWYWKLFCAPDGAQVLGTNIESFWTAVHGEPETWLETLCKPDGVRNFVEADKRQPTMAYATEERRQKWIASFSQPPGFQAPLNYYHSIRSGLQDKANRNIAEENVAVNVPFLFFGGQRDYVCRPEMLQESEDKGLIPDCTKVVVDSGHWAHLDKPKEFGEALVAWLDEKF